MKKTNVMHLFVLVMLILALIGGNAIVHMSITNDEGEIGITVGGGAETTAEDVESTEGENVGTEAPVETDGDTEAVETPNETEATDTEAVAPAPIETTEKNVETKPVEPETTDAVPETEDPTVPETEIPSAEETTAEAVAEESTEEVKEEEVK